MQSNVFEAAGNAGEERRRPIKDVTVIVNPVACPKGVEARKAEIIPKLEQRGWRVQAYETCAPEGALPEARRAVEAGTDLVIVVGGDGTVMEAINALIGTDIPIAIVPSGTGNVLALNLGIPTDVPHSLDIALTGSPHPIDLVEAKTQILSPAGRDGAPEPGGAKKYFAIMGGVGYDAQIMQETGRQAKQRFGRLAYIWTALKALGERRFPVAIRIDGNQAVHYRAKSVMIANMGEILPNLKVFPQARPDDGIIEVGVLKAARFVDFLHLVFHTLLGRPEEDPAFDAYQARQISLVVGGSEPLQLDGDPIGQAHRLDLTVAPGAIRVMMPRAEQAA